MTVEVRVPSVLRSITRGEKVVRGAGSTVAAVLEDVDSRYPGLRGQIYEGDRLRQFVNVYVNDEDIRYTGRLDTPVSTGDVLSILPAIAGGR